MVPLLLVMDDSLAITCNCACGNPEVCFISGVVLFNIVILLLTNGTIITIKFLAYAAFMFLMREVTRNMNTMMVFSMVFMFLVAFLIKNVNAVITGLWL